MTADWHHLRAAKEIARPQQRAVLMVLRLWIRDHIYDFEDQILTRRLCAWLEDTHPGLETECVGCLVGCLVGWLAVWLAVWLAGWLFGWLVGWLAVWLAGWLVVGAWEPADCELRRVAFGSGKGGDVTTSLCDSLLV